MPSNVTHRFVSPILWKLNQPLYSSAIQHVFAVAVVYTHRSVPPKQQPLNHKEYQTQIINSMRKHLEMEKLENFELISFTPQ